MIKKPKEEVKASKLNVREAADAILGDRSTLVVNLDDHLNELRKRGYSEALVEDFRSRLNTGEGEPS